MITVSSNFGDFAKSLKSEINNTLEAEMVDELVNRARADGESSVDYIDLNITGEGDGIRIDQARVKRLANQHLSGATPLIEKPRGLVGDATSLVREASTLVTGPSDLTK